MPELPEVTTIVRNLKEQLLERIIISVIVREEKLVGFPEDISTFIDEVCGKKILDINRRGKYILIKLGDELGEDIVDGKLLVIHLRMTGKLLIKDGTEECDKHTHIIFRLDNGQDLRFNNIRKFGRVYLIDEDRLEDAGGLAELGPEPLADDLTPEVFRSMLKRRKAGIKSLLLNQKFIAGVGNIYADEALFRAGINPGKKADSLSEQEMDRLYYALREVLQQGIKYNGTTFSDYVNALGKAGDFQHKLLVYQKQGEKCPRCGHEITREKIGGRSSHYCPHCQE